MPDSQELDSEAGRQMDILKDHCARLSEHFDSVQIFVTKHDKLRFRGTRGFTFGCGNWFARYGQVREWIVNEEQDA